MQQFREEGAPQDVDLSDPANHLETKQLRYYLISCEFSPDFAREIAEDLQRYLERTQEAPGVDEVINDPEAVEEWIREGPGEEASEREGPEEEAANFDWERFYRVEENVLRAAFNNPEQYFEAIMRLHERFSDEFRRDFMRMVATHMIQDDEFAQYILENDEYWEAVREDYEKVASILDPSETQREEESQREKQQGGRVR